MFLRLKLLISALIALASFLAGAISAQAQTGKCTGDLGVGDSALCNADGSCGAANHCVFIDCLVQPNGQSINGYPCSPTEGSECNIFSCWWNSGCNPCLPPV